MDSRHPPKITFETDNVRLSGRLDSPRSSSLTHKVITYSGGLVKNEQQAMYVLIGITIIAIVLSFFFLSAGGSSVKGPIPKGTSATVPG